VDIHQAALKGIVCLVREWDAAQIHIIDVNKKRNTFWWDAGRVLPDRLKWTRGTSGRRFVSGSAPDNDERRHSSMSSLAPSSVLPSLHAHLATWRGSSPSVNE
jgi:hypothetical protein